jgi:hypothetical protein
MPCSFVCEPDPALVCRGQPTWSTADPEFRERMLTSAGSTLCVENDEKFCASSTDVHNILSLIQTVRLTICILTCPMSRDAIFQNSRHEQKQLKKVLSKKMLRETESKSSEPVVKFHSFESSGHLSFQAPFCSETRSPIELLLH